MTLFSKRKIMASEREVVMEQNVSDMKTYNAEVEKNVGQKIKLFRQLRGLSQSDVAVHLGITFQQFQKYESGKNRIPIARLMRLAEIFGINMTVFFENSVNVMFEDIMKKKSSLQEEVLPIHSSSIRATGAGVVHANPVEDEEITLLVKNFKSIRDISVRKHISMLVKSLSEEATV